MHIRIELFSSYFKYVFSSDIPKYDFILDRNFKGKQNDINLKMKCFFHKLV